MRDIKFRIWADGKMIYLKPNYLIPLEDSIFGTLKRMEYSGRKDKNGIDIFEGDVEEKYNGVIEYNNDTCCWIVRRNNGTFVRLEVMINYIEIIGNKYEQNNQTKEAWQ